MVTQRVEQTGQAGLALSPWKAIGIFLAFTICLDAPFWVLVNATQTINAAYIFGMMWMPAIAAFVTCRVLGRPVRSLGLGTWNGRFVLLAYLIPIAYCLVASLGTWLFGFGGFPNVVFVRQTAESFGVGGAPGWVVIAMFVVLTGTTGMIAGVATADLPARQPQPVDAVHLLSADYRERQDEMGGGRSRVGVRRRRRRGRSGVLGQARRVGACG